MKLSTAATLALGLAAVLPFPATAQFYSTEQRQRQFEEDMERKQATMQQEIDRVEYEMRLRMLFMEMRPRPYGAQ